MSELKPITFNSSKYSKYQRGEYAQNLILKALSEGVTSIDELKKITGMKTAAQVYRTFDKMAIRKEYHEALAKNNISLDYIVTGIKTLCDTANKDEVRLKAYQTLLKSIGLDKYQEEEVSSATWEDAVIDALDKGKSEKSNDVVDAVYEVKQPVMPDSLKKKKDEEKDWAKGIYE